MGSTIVSDSTFSSNRGTSAGAISASGGMVDPFVLSVSDSTFTGNSVTVPDPWAGGGGAIHVGGRGLVTLTRDDFSDNAAVPAGLGGAVSIQTASAPTTIVDSTFTSNSAGSVDTGNGGAIWSESTTTIARSTFSGNTANFGGAVDWEYGVPTPHALTVTGSTFSANAGSGDWDGLAVMMCAYGQSPACGDVVTVANSTFDGDAISAWKGNLHVTNTTMSGGSVGGADVTTLANTIVAGGRCSPGGLVDGGGNLSFDSPGCPGISGDPMLLPLAWNGGPTQTMALGAGSAAFDAANDATCAATIGPPLFGAGGVDQRGVVRPQALCDIGAYELVVP
jgi:hypothetical protein